MTINTQSPSITSASKHQLPRILVTGGTGFIGRPLVHRLTKLGFPVTVFTRNCPRARLLLPKAVRCINHLRQIPDQEDIAVVINLAGEGIADKRWSAKRREQLFASRIGVTESLAHFFSTRKPPELLLSGSAIGYYGAQNDELLDEKARHQVGFAHHLCYEWESAASEFESLGARVCCLRLGVVLGQGGGMLQRLLLPFRLGLGGRIGDGRQWLSWIHRDDLIAALLFCLSHKTLSGPINLTAPEPVTNQEFTRLLATALERPALLPMPAWLVQVLFGEMGDELLLSGQRVIPAVLEASGFKFKYPSMAQALDACLSLD
ncbi:TIGR01777 family oxidoreductase [Maricurvus nonylphenolicus]|uniref:TIGR01777 family oxidoreductase n=1 Tax=Maricurvus nonylphenolicus TaxID=1008307 RepID=UPI0036F25D99